MYGASHLRRCLEAIRAQEDAPPFDVIVVHDPGLGDLTALRDEFPAVRFVRNDGQRTPMELASRALRLADFDVILMTKDHCVPRPDWVRALCAAQRAERGAVGGAIEVADDVRGVAWAMYFMSFHRYARPVREGPAATLTVSNVSYRRGHLDAVRSTWKDVFHETAVNAALRERFGPLWLTPAAEVRVCRRVRLGEAIRECFRSGWTFGATRAETFGAVRRLLYATAAPALPALLLGRMARAASVRPRHLRRMATALPGLATLTLAWAAGEWLGYVSGRRPAAKADGAPGEVRSAPARRPARRRGAAAARAAVHD